MEPLLCMWCRHYRRDNKCDAFPDTDIPDDILTGKIPHLKPMPELGQMNEIVFEKVPEAPL